MILTSVFVFMTMALIQGMYGTRSWFPRDEDRFTSEELRINDEGNRLMQDLRNCWEGYRDIERAMKIDPTLPLTRIYMHERNKLVGLLDDKESLDEDAQLHIAPDTGIRTFSLEKQIREHLRHFRNQD